MGDKIYNKNAREAHLMAEAYSSINEAYGDAEIAHLVQQATSAIKTLEELSETDASAEAALYNLRDILR
jgi:hypothetical protein